MTVFLLWAPWFAFLAGFQFGKGSAGNAPYLVLDIVVAVGSLVAVGVLRQRERERFAADAVVCEKRCDEWRGIANKWMAQSTRHAIDWADMVRGRDHPAIASRLSEIEALCYRTKYPNEAD